MTAPSPRTELAAGTAGPLGPIVEPVHFDARDFDLGTCPRVDLDAFVNARWRAKNPVPADRSCWDSFTILAERALQLQAKIAIAAAAGDAVAGSTERVVGDFWVSGMDEAAIAARGLDPLREELARIDALDAPQAIAAYIRERHARGDGVVFDLDAQPDFADPGTTIATISQGGLGLPDRDAYFDATPRGRERLEAYAEHVAKMLELSGWVPSEARASATDVVAFETRLAQVSLSRRTLARDIAQRYHPVGIEDADRISPNFAWSAFFAAQGLPAPWRFSLAMPDFHREVDAMLRTVPAAIWRAYLRFHTVDAAAPYLGDDFARQHHRFHAEILRGQQAMKPRWKRVLGAMNAHIGEILGELYVARNFPPESKRHAQKLLEQLRKALQSRLENLPWMSAPSKAVALEKLARLSAKIGYPDRWHDHAGLAASRSDYYGNVLAARAFNHRRLLGKIGKPVDKDEWPMTPQTVNAGYDPQRNEIVFPAAILQQPFFDAAADAALNYGGIGAVIAHEMTHGYDDQGSRFGPGGRFENWWPQQDRERFNALADRLVDQFNAQTAIDGESVNGQLTLGENIADFGGLAVAYDALQGALAADGGDDPMLDGYTQSQRFFLNWAVVWRQNLTPDEQRLRLKADPHAPSRLRANAAPSNLTAYAEAFGCTPGSPMARAEAERVLIW